MAISLFNGDVRSFIENYTGDKFHGILSDPPYHLGSSGFMGEEWDRGNIAFDSSLWEGFRNLLFPGSFVLIYCGAYNYHRLATAIEDGGFTIFPFFGWVHSQGMGLGRKMKDDTFIGYQYGKQSFKPAIEPIACAMVPPDGKYLESIFQYGSGAFNIANNMLGTENRFNSRAGNKPGGRAYNLSRTGMPEEYPGNQVVGRYPSNVVFDEDSIAAVEVASGKPVGDYFRIVDDASYAVFDRIANDTERVFYSKKADRAERDFGLEGCATVDTGVLQGRREKTFTDGCYPEGKNNHPTIKPLKLDTWLASVILPPTKYAPRRILNPFSGTGSEGIGAINAGWDDIVMVELDARYAEMSKLRIVAHTKHSVSEFSFGETDEPATAERPAEQVKQT